MNTDTTDKSIWNATVQCQHQIQNVITLLKSGRLFIDSVKSSASNNTVNALYDLYSILELAEVHCQKISDCVKDLIMSK